MKTSCLMADEFKNNIKYDLVALYVKASYLSIQGSVRKCLCPFCSPLWTSRSLYKKTILNWRDWLFLDDVFLSCGHGLDFDTSLCENSINQSRYFILNIAEMLCVFRNDRICYSHANYLYGSSQIVSISRFTYNSVLQIALKFIFRPVLAPKRYFYARMNVFVQQKYKLCTHRIRVSHEF